MKIVGFNFHKISVERKKEIKGSLKINSNLEVEKIDKDTIEIAGEILKFDYFYEIKYEPGFGEIIFKGEVLVVPEDAKQILKDWKKKKIENKIRIPLFNFIMSKCNVKALQLEEEFGLPPHIPLPKLSSQPQGQPGQANYTG